MASSRASLRSCRICKIAIVNMTEPRGLPCGHVCCRVCLSEMSLKSGRITCPDCKASLDTSIKVDGLPKDYGSLYRCEPCHKKGDMVQAKLFCQTCDLTMCESHVKSHDGLHANHSLTAAGSESGDPEAVRCDIHHTQDVGSSCENCLKLFCAQCLDLKQPCEQSLDGTHDLGSLPKMFKLAKEKLTTLAGELDERGKRVNNLYSKAKGIKESMKSDLNREISKLETSKDKQLKEIREKYDMMYKEVRTVYYKAERKIDEYIKILTDSEKLPMQEMVRKVNDALDSRDHSQVLKETVRLRKKGDLLSNKNIPTATVNKIPMVKQLPESRKVEVEVEGTGQLLISEVRDLPEPALARRPTGMSLIRSVSVSRLCFAVELYKSDLYIGKEGGVDVVSENGQSKSLIKLNGNIDCIKVHNQQLYILHLEGLWSLRVYSMDGVLITSWSHDDSSFYTNKFAIQENVLYIPSRSENRIKRYSLTSRPVLTDIYITLNSASSTSLCVTPAGFLVLTQRSPLLIVCLNLETDQQFWSLDGIVCPRGITSDTSNYLIVSTGCFTTTICLEVLHPDTGKVVGELKDNTERSEVRVYDLCVSDSGLLAVPIYEEKVVNLYKLQREDKP